MHALRAQPQLACESDFGPQPRHRAADAAQRWPAIELGQDGSNRFDLQHTAHDTLDCTNPATLPQNVACRAVTAWLAAQAPLRFGPPVL